MPVCLQGIATLPGPLPSTYQQRGDLTLKDVCVDGVELEYTDDGKRESARYKLDFVMCQGTDTGRDDPTLKACRTTPQERGRAGSFRSQ